MSTAPRFYYWAPAPNRHLDPLLEGLRGTGALIHEFYGADRLVWQQLGTPSTAPEASRTLLGDDSAAAVKRVLRDLEPDAMHLVHGMRDLSASVSQVLGSAATRFIMCESPLPRPALSAKRMLRDAFYRRQTRSVTGVFAVSRFAAAAVRDLDVPIERIVPVAYAVPPTPARAGSRSGTRILFCGRVVLRKGVDLLMNALLVLHSAGVPFTFDFAGEGPEAPRMVAFLEKHAIPFANHGSVSSTRVMELMAEASVVAVPSLMWEGWGYVVNEAIAAGAPLVVSDIVGASELIVPGVNGFVFRAGDLDGLVSALRECLNSSRSINRERDELQPRLVAAAGSAEVADYMVATMLALRDGASPPVPPWHALITKLGGNGSIDWWNHARQGRPMPAAPFIAPRLLRQI